MTESWLFVQDETKQGEEVVLLTLLLLLGHNLHVS